MSARFAFAALATFLSIVAVQDSAFALGYAPVTHASRLNPHVDRARPSSVSAWFGQQSSQFVVQDRNYEGYPRAMD